MIQLTLADLIAIAYWKERGYHQAVIASMLSMTTEEYKNSFISSNLLWAIDIGKQKR